MYDISHKAPEIQEDILEDIEELKQALIKLNYTLDNLYCEKIVPLEEFRKIRFSLKGICNYLSHTWESDACNYLDCIRCAICGAGPTSIEEVNELIIRFPKHVVKKLDGRFADYLTLMSLEKYKHLL